MAGIAIERNAIEGLVVLGQVQYDYTVNGVQHLSYGEGVMESAFARSVVYETEMTAVSAALRKRREKLQDLQLALATVNSVLTNLNSGTGSSKINLTDDAIEKGFMKQADYDELQTVAKRYGLSMDSDRNSTFGGLQKRQADLNASIEKENNDLQSTTSFLKNLVSKRDSATQQLGKIMKKVALAAQKTVGAIGS